MELIINDVKLEGDLMDADFMEKFEQSMIKMRDTAQAKKRENFPTAAANYRAQCEVVNVCFDEIFGAGTADRLFHGKMNVMEHLKAIEKVSEWAEDAQRLHQPLHPAPAGCHPADADRAVRLPAARSRQG